MGIEGNQGASVLLAQSDEVCICNLFVTYEMLELEDILISQFD